LIRWKNCLFFFLLINPVFAAEPQRLAEKIFTFRIRAEPETLDWNKAHTVVEAYILMNLMEGLVTFEGSKTVAPALAEKWTLSADGKTYTFQLRSGVKWTDGVPLKAQDFVDSWRRLLSPLTASSYSYLLFDIDGAEDFNKGKITDFSQVGVKALNPQTLQVKLSHPVAHWIYIPGFWATFPIRKDIIDSYGTSWEIPGRIVTLGPFSLVAHDIDSKIVLKSNPTYYRDHGNVSQVVALIIKDDSQALQLYEAGKLDFLTDLATVDLQQLTGRKDLQTFQHLKTGFLEFMTGRFPTSNVKLRRAIAMAIDKVKLADTLFGEQIPANSFVPPPMMASSQGVGLPFDPVKAKQELRASGLDLGDSLKIDYGLPNWDKAKSIAQFIRNELKKHLGIEIVLQTMDNKTYRNQLDLHSFPMFDYTWTADYPDPDNFLSVFLSTSGNSLALWKNEKFDRGVQKARVTQNAKEREKIYIDLQKILLQDEAVIVPLYYEPNLALVRPRAKNFELNPLDYLYLRKVDIVP
jgi:oligopeptide transport system substrate-binding protein